MDSIFTSLSPNTEKDDIFLAFKLIFQPWKSKISINQQNQHKSAVQELEEEFRKYLGVKYAFSFNSGRSGFLAILSALDLEQGSEILVQGFTCNAVINPIIWSRLRQGYGGQAGLKPVFVDIKQETLNIDSQDLKNKITDKSRAVIVQHTFGLPTDMNEILKICKQHNLTLIEDCAHSLGAVYNGQKVGTFGRASFFSFGRDKIISSVYGGMVITNDDELAKKIKDFQEKCDFPSNFWIFQQLLHPILCNFLIIPLYGFLGLGRWILLAFQRLKILSKAVHKKEKKGQQPSYFPKKMPNVLAILALHQFKKLEKFITHQRKIAQFYDNNLSNCRISDILHNFVLPEKNNSRAYMRYPILIKNRDTDEILKKARKQKIFLNDGWRKAVIVPADTDQEKMGYVSGACPVAEKVAQNILNLPTHINISEQKAREIINFINNELQYTKNRE